MKNIIIKVNGVKLTVDLSYMNPSTRERFLKSVKTN